jgi:hypothetical protein
MTGAGSSSVAWTPESSYLGGPQGTPTYYEPGTNVQVQNIELTRNLLSIYAPGDVEAQDFLAQNLEGALGISWILKNDDYHRLLFNDGFTGFTSGLANSAIWYLGVDYTGGTTERQIKGWAPATCQIQYNGSTETVRVTMTGAYGDEEYNTSITPGSLSNTGDEVPGFGTTFKVAGSAIGDRLQSAQLSFEQISRLQTGNSQKPIEAVQGNVQESVDMTAIYDGPTQYERALGSAGSTSVQQTVDSVTADLEFAAGGSTVADYSFSTVKPNSYNWEDLVNNEVDLNEAIVFNATGVTGSDPTA